MVFWKTNYHHPFDKSSISSPTNTTYEVLYASADHQQKQEVCNHLLAYFGNPPHTPSFDIPVDQLLIDEDYILLVRAPSTSLIVGCIRYHYVGEYEGTPIHVVDCFCIHPIWRKKGVGDYLLTELHRYSNAKGIPYALFLKEGINLPLSNTIPIYSGRYIYRPITSYEECPFLYTISLQRAHRLIAIYQTFYHDRLIITNTRPNQEWRIFEYTENQNIKRIIIGIQDSFQRLTPKGKRMAWVTTWLETPEISNEMRLIAANAVAHSLYPAYGAIWMDQAWMGDKCAEWEGDGAFHWYAYQWNTTPSVKNGYALMM